MQITLESHILPSQLYHLGKVAPMIGRQLIVQETILDRVMHFATMTEMKLHVMEVADLLH